MRKVYWLAIATGLIGVWFLDRAVGNAQDPSKSFASKFLVIILSVFLVTGSILANRYAKAYMRQPKNTDLEILTKVKMERK